jgi:hypothetical protein
MKTHISKAEIKESKKHHEILKNQYEAATRNEKVLLMEQYSKDMNDQIISSIIYAKLQIIITVMNTWPYDNEMVQAIVNNFSA